MSGERITCGADGSLTVPNEPIIPFIEGDGIGPEVTAATQAIVNAAVKRAYGGARRLHWHEVQAGGKSFKQTGEWLPEATLDAFKHYLVGLKGPLTTPVGGGIRSLNVALRQTLDLYVCLRPVRYFAGIGSPLVHPEWVDMVIFRENTEDIYAGIEWEQGTPEARRFGDFLRNEMHVTKVRFPETSAYGVKPVSIEGTERLVRAAIEYAIEHRRPSVTLVHKGNIMKFTEGGFKRWGYALAQREFAAQTFTMVEYEAIAAAQGKAQAKVALSAAKAAGKVIIQDCIADAFLQNTLLRPRDYSVIATLNLNGDYVSDQLAAMVGGIGIAPGANINGQTGHAIFEATHGTAPDLAGQGKANPCSLLLSALLLLHHLGWSEAATMVEASLEQCFQRGMATGDLTALMPHATQTLSTTAFAEEVIKNLGAKHAGKPGVSYYQAPVLPSSL